MLGRDESFLRSADIPMQNVLELYTESGVGRSIFCSKGPFSDVVVIYCQKKNMPDPVYALWRLIHARVLADGAHVLIVGMDTDVPAIADLKRLYACLFFGRYLLLRYVLQDRVPVLPSQKGLFMEGR